VIHNPHYYEWQRQNNGGVAPRVAGDVCGMNDIRTQSRQVLARMGEFLNIPSSLIHTVNEISRGVLHLQQVQAPRFRMINPNESRENRIKFLTNEITEIQFERRCTMHDKGLDRNKDILDVIELQIQGLTDIMSRMAEVTAQSGNLYLVAFEELYKEMEALTVYSNLILKEHAKTYCSKVYVMSLSPINILNGDVMI
jgi:hypothetical protein